MTNSEKRKEILEKALQCVNGERDGQYGSPEDNFQRIAYLWEAYLQTKCVNTGTNSDTDVCILPQDVAAMMVLLKVARLTGNGDTDSWVDIAGYAACGGGIG